MPNCFLWLRRDLRLEDHAALYEALTHFESVQPVFIFDHEILHVLKDKSDARVTFLHQTLGKLKEQLRELGSDLWVEQGTPLEVFEKWLRQHKPKAVICSHDYEPLAIQRDQKVKKLCESLGVEFRTVKDQVIFEKSEVLTDQGKPYTVYTPYSKKWRAFLSNFYLKSYPVEKYFRHLNQTRPTSLLTLKDLGFTKSQIPFPSSGVSNEILRHYGERRDFPSLEATSRLGLHLRFGTVSVRELARRAKEKSDVWLSELIWREFFMQILFHYPQVMRKSFRPAYDEIEWRKDKSDFERWKEGQTGYPLVDAGMRELNSTGYMHNRVRMVVASFLTKHLLIHWYHGERYFAEKLLDYDLAANNGNWQWAAGSGCDAAPYFRIFNPQSQMEKFDPQGIYVRKWVPEWGTPRYKAPMVEHSQARARALEVFGRTLKGGKK